MTMTSAAATPTKTAAVSKAIGTTYITYNNNNNGYSQSGSSNNDTRNNNTSNKTAAAEPKITIIANMTL